MDLNAKRICFFMENLYGGGAERSMLTTAIGFKDKGYAVDLFLISADGAYRKDVPKDIRIIESGIYRYKLTLIILFFKIVRHILFIKPDAIVSALNVCNILLIFAKIITRSKVKCLVTIRNIEDTLVSKKYIIRYCKHELLSKMQVFLSPCADKIVTVSLGLADYVKSKNHCSSAKLVTIYNPVNSEEIIAKSKENIDVTIGLNNDSLPVVITSGRLHSDKNFSALITAIKKVHQRMLVHLIILGDGDLRDELQELIDRLELQSYVDLLGFKDNPFAYMSHSDLFVLSSNHEGFGRVLVEAMACGCPVVSTDCPSGPREILEDGKWGRLVPIGDIDAMAEAIIDTLENPIPKKLLVERAKYFSIERAVAEYERVIYG